MSHALPFSACLLVPSEQGAPGRMALVGPQCAGRRRTVSRLSASLDRGVGVVGSEQEAVLWAKPFDQRGRPDAEVSAPIWWTQGVVKRAPLHWDHNVVTAHPSFVEDASPFLDRSGCHISSSRLEADFIGRRARTRNTFQALLRPEGSKAPIPSFPGSTFPAEA